MRYGSVCSGIEAGDFTKIGPEAGPVDILVGGTPCQSFSVAGKRLGLDDPRGNLALEYLSLARRLRARWIVWENVPGVLSSYSGSEQAARDVQEGPVGGEGNGIEDRDFAMFLSFVRECGYGFAYRVLDAQYIRVDGLARAVPQRRERVFLVGYLGDWRPAAAVLFEPEGMRRDPAPSRKAGQRVAGTVTGGAHPGGFNGQDAYNDKLIAHAIVPPIAGTMKAMRESGGFSNSVDHAAAGYMVAHSLRADGFDASEDGTGRGTPIVPVIAKTLTRGAESAGKGGYAGRRQEDDDNIVAQVLPFDTTQITSKANRSVPKIGDPSHPIASDAHAPAIAFNWQQGGDHTTSLAMETERTPTIQRSQSLAVHHGWAVRRLTPRECERLQGFPDDFTNVPYRGKQAADGPRYKALGNSMAVNCMRWIGQRIDIMEAILEAERAAA